MSEDTNLKPRRVSLSKKIHKISAVRPSVGSDESNNDVIDEISEASIKSDSPKQASPESSVWSEVPSVREEPIGSSGRSRDEAEDEQPQQLHKASTSKRNDLLKSHEAMSEPVLGKDSDSGWSVDRTARSKSLEPSRTRPKACLLGPGGTVLVSRKEARMIFPEDTATIVCGTWNVSAKAPKLESLRRWLQPPDGPQTVDVYALSLQEVTSLDMCFHQGVVSHIEHVLGKTHCAFLWVRKWGQMLLIFIRRTLLPFCTDPAHHFIPSEVVAKPAKTKGAIGAYFRLMHVSFLFVGCHLSYGPKSDRIRDYHKISQALQFARMRKHRAENCCNTAICCADNVFWFGDLNFSVVPDPGGVTDHGAVARLIGIGGQLVGERAVNSVLLRDQLTTEMKHGTIFEKFREPKIKFRPTYKYKEGTGEYHPERVPSYTDRILYRNNTKTEEAIEPTLYNCVHDECMSDHKPVYAVFKVRVVPKQKLPQDDMSVSNLVDLE